MSTPSDPKAFIHVEVLDFSRDALLMRELADYYCTLHPERLSWTAETRARLTIRSECRWGRVPIGNSVFMFSEFGEGPREPLSATTSAHVRFFAEMRPSGPNTADGYVERSPFCQVQFDDEGCRRLRAQGLAHLEAFIRRTVPECARALDEWQALLTHARARYLELKASQLSRAPAAVSTP
jgi:hypothetical protein